MRCIIFVLKFDNSLFGKTHRRAQTYSYTILVPQKKKKISSQIRPIKNYSLFLPPPPKKKHLYLHKTGNHGYVQVNITYQNTNKLL